jgi:hypothetical protein
MEYDAREKSMGKIMMKQLIQFWKLGKASSPST